MKLKILWFYFNVAFVLNYAFALVRLLTFFPLPPLPNFFNALCLMSAYACSLAGAYKNVQGIFTNQNFMCVLFFATFPPWILLFPFFLLAVFHANTCIVEHKKMWGGTALYSAALMLNHHAFAIGRMALHAEIYALLLAVPLVFLRVCSVKSLLAYGLVVRKQYTSNPSMHGIISSMLLQLDGAARRMPAFLLAPYSRAKHFVQGQCTRLDPVKKTQ
ncbi:hypothetical protein PAPHI01_2221 [Pancytospora philotis]|nr:hypothetical protein PAPHI01_2221 [Pancytospora philotis]